jgi:hypothetical protein
MIQYFYDTVVLEPCEQPVMNVARYRTERLPIQLIKAVGEPEILLLVVGPRPRPPRHHAEHERG